jgi:16S rRNA (cytosine1402-N4)-methyltransferase
MYHKPVMLDIAIDGLSIKPEGIYVDATFGGGGHAKEILSRLGDGRLIAFDQDKEAEKNVPDDSRFTFLNHNFRHIENFLRLYSCLPIDGIIADLGVSSHQFDKAGRGFSTRFPGPLDMRMDASSGLTAKEVINSYERQSLEHIFHFFGELRQAGKIVQAIEDYRQTKTIETTDELIKVLNRLAPRGKENKFFAQVFQALRIEVNHELEALKELLVQCPLILKPGGRVVIISYHSLEDRMVKNFFRAGNFLGEVEKDFFGNPLNPLAIVGKPQAASKEEIKVNPRARSARLRIAEKKK